ncbi:YlmC/YmxH family sporulation protein [Sporomusa aerivorans]|uniref:YlmC/YmxH family sporulation protein n=1 Tax=Sporomusa aerivorans TaxID=204936 RepID=UPI003529ECD7
MRLSEMSGKEVINLGDGARLGNIADCEVTFDSRTGVIGGLILPKRRALLNLLADNQISVIPWQAIKRIGDEVVIVDLNNAYDRFYSTFSGE